MPRIRSRLLSAALAVSAVATFTSACHGGPHVTFIVSSTADGTDATPGDGRCEVTIDVGDCSLRAAIMESNATNALTDTTIELASDETYDLTITGIDASALVGDLDVTRDVTINGNGSTISGSAHFIPIFEHFAGTLVVNHATLDGNAGWAGSGLPVERDMGGALLNHATVQFSDVDVHGRARAFGIAIHQMTGTTTLLRSRVSDNEANPGGGGATGIWIRDGDLNLIDSEVSRNVATTITGGASTGIRTQAGTARLIRSTVTGHIAEIAIPSPPFILEVPGSGIYFEGQLYLVSSTVVDNGEDLTGNGSGTALGSVLGLCGTSLVSEGHNVDEEFCLQSRQPSDAQTSDTVFGPLGFNGGPTRTLVPLAGSVLVDSIPAGTPVLCDGTLPTDQRGEPKPIGAGCDRGSVERQADDP